MIALDRDELMMELHEAANRFEMLLRSLTDKDAACSVEGLTWTVGETAAHVLTIIRRVITDFRRSTSAADLVELNAKVLEETPHRNPQVIADLFAADMGKVMKTGFPRLHDDRYFPFHAGTQTTVKHAIGIVLGELLIHGQDIARATGKEWEISPRTATLIWLGTVGVAYGWLKPDVQANETYEIHFNGQDVTAWMRFHDGKLDVSTDPMPPADYTMHVDPFDFLMVFPYGRKVSPDPNIQRLASMFHPL